MQVRSIELRSRLHSTSRSSQPGLAHKFLDALQTRKGKLKRFARSLLLGLSFFSASGCQSASTAIQGEFEKSLKFSMEHNDQTFLPITGHDFFQKLASDIKKNPHTTGVHLVSENLEAFHTRLWLFDQAKKSIDLRYFRWANDNSGLLLFDCALRAAERGVRVRILLDALLLDLPQDFLLALDHHPNLDIEIYNPMGSPFGLLFDMSPFRYRMHLKTMIVDNEIALLGGRNVADEYFSFSQHYNYRDREVLLFGGVVPDASNHFGQYWTNAHSVSVHDLWKADAEDLADEEVRKVYRDLHAYARNPRHFAGDLRRTQRSYARVMEETLRQKTNWAKTVYVADPPGKEDQIKDSDEGDWLDRHSPTSDALAHLIQKARVSVLMQTPYFGLTSQTRQAFRTAQQNEVHMEMSTCHLNSSAVMACYSVYRGQLDELMSLGIHSYEFRSHPQDYDQYMGIASSDPDTRSSMWLHAKSFVFDGRIAYVGTTNFNPRSNCLNTEEGVIVYSEPFARDIRREIQRDIRPENSWTSENAPWFDQHKYLNGVYFGFLRILPEGPMSEF